MPKLHTRTHTLVRTVTGVHIHIRSILSIALLGHTHTYTRTHIHPPAAGESFALELGLKRAICILFFSLSSLSASALPISLLVTSHHKTKKKTKKPSTTTLSLCLQRKRERESGGESVKERKHSKLVSRLSNFKVSALRAFLPTNPIVTQSVYRFPVCFGLLLIFYTILRIGHTQISLRKFVSQTGSTNGLIIILHMTYT